MAESIRFYLDEHMPQALADGLSRRGLDALTTAQADRCGATDEEQLAFARENTRVLVPFPKR